MPKYTITMNYVAAYTTKFTIDGPDDDSVQDVLTSMNSDFLENNLKWEVSDYEAPIVQNISVTEEKDSDLPEVSNKFYREFNRVQKEIYE